MPTRAVLSSVVPHAGATQGPRSALSAGVYSIGAVASMVGVPQATLRTWEERYGLVLPERTRRGHRLYSRSQIEQLRLVTAEMLSGATAGDAHRSLARRMATRAVPETPTGARPRVLILVAERDEYSGELMEFLLHTEGFAVEVVLNVDGAKRRFEQVRPDLIIIEFLLGGGEGEGLCRWLKAQGAQRVLVVSGLEAADRALKAGADGFLRKPIGHLLLVSAVKDLLGLSALLRQEG
ncbi:MAG TPA: MerR family transcriptional regulator [Solirubrobacteraceae bacterium]